MQAARGEMPGLPTRLAQRTSRRLDLESGQLSKSRTVGMTKIFNDPKSCIFSSYLRCWPDPPGPRSNQDDRLASLPPSGAGPAADSSPRWRSAASSFTRCSRPRYPRGPHPRRVRPGQTYSRTDLGVPGSHNDVITTVTNKTVYVDVAC
jgi:hypothetical protein